MSDHAENAGMGDPRHALGHDAESAAAGWLSRHGWQILAVRHRAPGQGEIDLVCLDPARRLVAVEVRARRTARTGSPAESIDERRLARLARALAAFAARGGIAHAGLGVDLVTVEPVLQAVGRWRLRRLPLLDAAPGGTRLRARRGR